MCIGSSVDHMPFNPISESPKSDDAEIKMDFTYDSFVKEEIIDVDNEEEIDEDNNYGSYEENNLTNNHCFEEKPILQQPQLFKTTPRTVVISPKQSKGPIAINNSKQLSKPVFIPINLSNVKTIKVRSYFFQVESVNNYNLNIIHRLLIRMVKQSMLMHSDDYSP